MKVKVAFGSDIRIWRKKVENFNSLVSFVENSFEQLNEDFLITYEDDEGDHVTITSDDDLEEAVDLYKSLEKRSIKVFVALKKNAHRITDDEPGAFQPELKEVAISPASLTVNEIVSEPGGGLEAEEKDDGLDVQFISSPPSENTLTSSVRSDQIEGSPAKQSMMYWMRTLLPILSLHGAADELTNICLPCIFNLLESGDDLGTAIQTSIARCPLLQEQSGIREFMAHVQAKVAPLSDEIVPHVHNLGCSGMIEIVDALTNVSKKWKRGIADIKFDLAPFISKIWPAAFARLQQQKDLPCELVLDKFCLPPMLKKEDDPETKLISPTPFAAEDSSSSQRFRLVKEDSWEKKNSFEKKGSWERRPPPRYSGGRRCRGARGGRWRHSAHRRGPHGHGGHDRLFSPTEEHWSYGGPPHHNHHQNHKTPYGAPPNPPSYSHSHSYNSNSQTRGNRHHHSQSSHSSSHHYYFHPDEPSNNGMLRDDYKNSDSGNGSSSRNTHSWEQTSSSRNKRMTKTPTISRRFDFSSQTRGNYDNHRLENPQKKEVRVSTTPLKADFIDHVNIPLRSKYLAGQRLLKKWCVRNVGADAWDESVKLKFTKGDDTLPTKKIFSVPNCNSGALCELSALIETPEDPGRYTAYFRLNRGDINFGPRIWVDVHVVATEEELVTKTDDQTRKRLELIDNRASATRPQPNRRSTPKLRKSQRSTKIKKSSAHGHSSLNNLDLDVGSSSLGYVNIPIFASKQQTNGSTARNSKLNKDAEEFKPMMKNSNRDTYAEQIKELYNMGFENHDDRIPMLLKQHQGDMTKVIEVLVAPNNI